jgi:hypothetical protein
MKPRASIAFAVISTAAALGVTAPFPFPATAGTVTHTLRVISAQHATARFAKTTEGVEDKDVNRARPALPPDSGLAGCAALAGTHQVAGADYPTIGAQFDGSRWPDLRFSGLAYIEIATKLLTTRAYGGETAWFYQRAAVRRLRKARAPVAFLILASHFAALWLITPQTHTGEATRPCAPIYQHPTRERDEATAATTGQQRAA